MKQESASLFYWKEIKNLERRNLVYLCTLYSLMHTRSDTILFGGLQTKCISIRTTAGINENIKDGLR